MCVAAIAWQAHPRWPLVVIANRGTLETPRWVRVEVEEFRKAHPGRPVIPISIDGALEDPTLLDTIRPWLNVKETIWLDDTQDAVDKGAASRPVVGRLSLAPRRLRTAQWWRVTVIGVALSLVALTASSLWSEQRARANAARAEASATAARAAEARALGELRASTGLRLRAESTAMLARLRPEPDERAMLQLLAAQHLTAPGRALDPEAEGDLQAGLLAKRNLVRLASGSEALLY